MADSNLWNLEREFWLGGPSVYERSMGAACVMAFPELGIMKGSEIIESLKQGPRWSSVEMRERELERAGESIVVLAYRAEARRRDSEPYMCWCTSTYRLKAAQWSLIQHQQTIAE